MVYVYIYNNVYSLLYAEYLENKTEQSLLSVYGTAPYFANYGAKVVKNNEE